MGLKHIINDPSQDIKTRFPADRFTIFEIPYIVLDHNTSRIHVLRYDEWKSLDPQLQPDLKIAVVVTKKFNWSMKNDLIRKSQWFSPASYKWETNSDIYTKNLVKEVLVYILDDGEEVYVDEAVRSGLSQHFVEGFLHYFFRYEHFETMESAEEDELRRHIHKFYKYWRKANSKRPEDQARVAGEDPPVCPSVILEVGLADRFNWTLEYIRNLSEKDVRSIQILQSQKEIADYEASDGAKRFGDPRKKGTTITRNLSYKEAVQMMIEDEEDKKKKRIWASEKKSGEKKPMSQAQIRAKELRELQKNSSKIKKE